MSLGAILPSTIGDFDEIFSYFVIRISYIAKSPCAISRNNAKESVCSCILYINCELVFVKPVE